MRLARTESAGSIVTRPHRRDAAPQRPWLAKARASRDTVAWLVILGRPGLAPVLDALNDAVRIASEPLCQVAVELAGDRVRALSTELEPGIELFDCRLTAVGVFDFPLHGPVLVDEAHLFGAQTLGAFAGVPVR